MNKEKNNYNYIFHSTESSKNYLSKIIKENNLKNTDVVSNEKIKISIIKKSTFAIVKSGTVSLEVCKYGVPSVIIYKMNFLNFFIAKLFLKIKFANMINIINNKEIIPELLQKECNPDEIYNAVNYLLKKPELINEQLIEVNKTINKLRSTTSSSNEASNVLLSYLR
jgi:Lipid A disaccharide synthetase